MPPWLLYSRKSPHKLLLMAVLVLLGASYLAGAKLPDSVAATNSAWATHLWSGALFLSGVTGFAGVYWRGDIVRGLRLEEASMYLGTAAIWLYAASVFGHFGWQALAAGLTYILWGAANMWRAVQIRADLKRLKAMIEGVP